MTATRGSKTLSLMLVGGLVVWVALQAVAVHGRRMVDDWHGWRQSDTQTIALNFAKPDGSLLYPQIAWGGDGPGYVESELHLYPWITACIMSLVGESENVGRYLSLLFFALTSLLLFFLLDQQFGRLPAALGLLAWLSSRNVIFLATSVQPESLCVLGYVVGLAAFLRYLESGGWAPLAWSVAGATLAGLVKPTALHLGITMFLLVALAHRSRLFEPRLWAAWTIIVASVALHLWHAQGLYTTYGNTFGVLSGGDSKIPSLEHLLMPSVWLDLVKVSLRWGIGIPGVAAGAWLLMRRRLGPIELALLVGNAAMLVLTLRYTSAAFGSHYHIFSVVTGAWLVAKAFHGGGTSFEGMPRRLAAGALALVCLLLLASSTRYRANNQASDYWAETIVMGEELARFASPGDLVSLRSTSTSYDEFWKTPDNYQDPRAFYVARVRGWSIPADATGADALRDQVARGSRYYGETGERRDDPDLEAFLSSAATLLVDRPNVRIYRLEP